MDSTSQYSTMKRSHFMCRASIRLAANLPLELKLFCIDLFGPYSFPSIQLKMHKEKACH
jgi:hypothetical protein